MGCLSRVVHFSFPFLVHYCIPGDMRRTSLPGSALNQYAESISGG